jgi:phage terminase small subunit
VAKKPKKAEIKDDLLRQLEENGTYGSQYVDLVEDYMALWDLKNKLIKDIRTRGAMIEWENGEYQKGVKKNDAVVELPKINKQMLMLLKELGLRAVDSKADDQDDEL